jgi:hypothetical protein
MMVRKNVVVGANKGKVKAAMGRGYNGRLKAARRNSAGSTHDGTEQQHAFEGHTALKFLLAGGVAGAGTSNISSLIPNTLSSLTVSRTCTSTGSGSFSSPVHQSLC